MALNIVELPGADLNVRYKLRAAGLTTSDKLLEAVSRPQTRADLAQRLQVSEHDLLALSKHADLVRIRGIGSVYSDLLEFAGVTTVVHLAECEADGLYSALRQVALNHHVRRCPSRTEVGSWIARAQALVRSIATS